MFKLLRGKIVLLYTFTTGLILTIVIIIILMFTERQLEAEKVEAFQSNINTLVNKLQLENTLTYTWLSQMEAKNRLLIHIEDNGISLTFPGAITTPTNRKQLQSQLNVLALKENIDISKYPIYSNEVKSSIFSLRGSKKEAYYGCVVIVPTSSGWRSLSLLNYLPGNLSSIRRQRILFLFFDFIGISALYIVSQCFVTKMLRPIEENNEKQTRFIAAASHELRSPLTVIRAYNSVLTLTTLEAQKFTTGID